MARNLFDELRSMTGLQQQSAVESYTVWSMHNFDYPFQQQALNKGQYGILLVEACVTTDYAGDPG